MLDADHALSLSTCLRLDLPRERTSVRSNDGAEGFLLVSVLQLDGGIKRVALYFSRQLLSSSLAFPRNISVLNKRTGTIPIMIRL